MVPADIMKKPYGRLVLPDEDGSYTAEIVEFPGCIASGSTTAEALANLEEVAADWIVAALEQGQSIPEPLESAGYSGKLVVRMAKSLHQRAAFWAERDGVSLNQFIVNCIAEQVGQRARPLLTQLQPAPGSAMVNIQMVVAPLLHASGLAWSQQNAVSSTGSWLGPVYQEGRDVAHA